MSPDCEALLIRVRACTLCHAHLPLGPRPVLQLHPDARILIVGQAPGKRVHETGIPFNDPSGDRLRQWLGIDRETFYDPHRIALVPMGFCFPGTGRAGDLPPRPECAAAWRRPLLAQLSRIEMTLALGQYAQSWHFAGKAPAGISLTQRVRAWRDHWPALVPLPHPSPRNNRWLIANPWFAQELLPQLALRVAQILRS